MATIGTNARTLTDVAKTWDPDGKPARIVELLSQCNQVLDDVLFVEGNLPTGTRTTVRTGLPSVTWRLFNQGVQVTKSTTAQFDEHCGMMEAWSEVDVDLAKLNGNAEAYRLSEASAYIEAMNQEFVQTLFYGNAGVSPEEFTGLATRYSTLGQNCISGGGSGSDQSSIWLIGWGANTIHAIYPKAMQGGLEHKDHGETVTETVNGVGGSRMAIYRDQWKWKAGIAVRDWRYAVRGCNIDISNLVAESSAANLTKLMIKMWHRIPTMTGAMTKEGYVGVKPAWYMNRTVAQMLDIQRYNVMSGAGTGSQNLGGSIEWATIDGKYVPTFRGIPIRIVDQLLETESTVS